MKISNTAKHFELSIAPAVIMFFLSLAVQKAIIGHVLFLWIGGTLGWEACQRYTYGLRRPYWKYRWLDVSLDLIVGNALPIIVYLFVGGVS